MMSNFYFNLALFGATSSIADMRILAEQTEHTINNSIANTEVVESEYEDEHEDEEGNIYEYTQKVYSCGSCVSYEESEAKAQHEHLITQLTRRSAFLTIFGIFEYHMSACRKIMIRDTGYDSKKLSRGIVEGTEELLRKAIGNHNAPDLKHLSVIRNFFTHNDGKYYEYKDVKNKPDTERDKKERRTLIAFEQATAEFSGISLNDFNSITMDESFLPEAIDVLEAFAKALSDAITHYGNHKLKTTSL